MGKIIEADAYGDNVENSVNKESAIIAKRYRIVSRIGIYPGTSDVISEIKLINRLFGVAETGCVLRGFMG